MRALFLLALVAPTVSDASPPDRRSEPPRFRVKAQLEATPPAVTDARFRLQASLAPRQRQVSMEAVGFALNATLQPKGGGPICFGPVTCSPTVSKPLNPETLKAHPWSLSRLLKEAVDMRSRRAFDSNAVVRDAPKPWRPRAPDPVASRIWKRLAFSALVVLVLLISSALRTEPVPTHTNEPAQPAVIH